MILLQTAFHKHIKLAESIQSVNYPSGNNVLHNLFSILFDSVRDSIILSIAKWVTEQSTCKMCSTRTHKLRFDEDRNTMIV